MYPVVTFRKFWAVHNYNDGSDHPGLPERHYSGKMVGQRYNGYIERPFTYDVSCSLSRLVFDFNYEYIATILG